MTREDIIRMAREADLADTHSVFRAYCELKLINHLERFAALVAAAEREACANVCEKITSELSNWPAAHDGVTAETKFIRGIGETIGKPFVEAIRARGNT